MALHFNRAANSYLRCNDTPVQHNTGTVTLATWVRFASKTANMAILGGFSGSGTYNAGLYLEYLHSNNTIRATCYIGTAWYSASTAAPDAGKWFHLAGKFSSGTSRKVYLNGVSMNTSSTSVSWEPLEYFLIGAYGTLTTAGAGLDGEMEHAAVWNTNIDDSDIAKVARGVSPLKVRPDRLTGYWSLYDLNDLTNRSPVRKGQYDVDQIVGSVTDSILIPPVIRRHAEFQLARNPEPKVIAAPSPYISGARIRDRWAGLGRRY